MTMACQELVSLDRRRWERRKDKGFSIHRVGTIMDFVAKISFQFVDWKLKYHEKNYHRQKLRTDFFSLSNCSIYSLYCGCFDTFTLFCLILCPVLLPPFLSRLCWARTLDLGMIKQMFYHSATLDFSVHLSLFSNEVTNSKICCFISSLKWSDQFLGPIL